MPPALAPFLDDLRRERRSLLYLAVPLWALGVCMLLVLVSNIGKPGLTPWNYTIPGVLLIVLCFLLPAVLIVRRALSAPVHHPFWRALADDPSRIVWIYATARGVMLTLDSGAQRLFRVPAALADELAALAPDAQRGWTAERQARFDDE